MPEMSKAFCPQFLFKIPSHHPQGVEGDSLVYQDYARAICEMLANTTAENTGMTIGIFGDWGMGKSSVLSMVWALLDPIENPSGKRFFWLKKRAGIPLKWFRWGWKRKLSRAWHLCRIFHHERKFKPLVVFFDAWKYPRQGELWLAFLRRIFGVVEKSFELRELARLNFVLWRKRLQTSPVFWSALFKILLKSFSVGIVIYIVVWILQFFFLDDYGKGLNPLAFSLVGGGIPLVSAVLKSAWKAIDAILGNRINISIPSFTQQGYDRGQTIEIDDFSTDLNAALETIAQKRPLVILIDDLDRCTPDQIVSVLEAIKHFEPLTTESSPTLEEKKNQTRMYKSASIMFVLAADRRAIERAVRAHFKDYMEEMIDSERDVFAREYIEKIVQVPFELPPLTSRHLEEFLDIRAGFAQLQLDNNR
jgi:hypothetical protein